MTQNELKYKHNSDYLFLESRRPEYVRYCSCAAIGNGNATSNDRIFSSLISCMSVGLAASIQANYC